MLSLDIIIALSIFATVSSITPGPNNIMLLASGVNFGFKRTIPHILGICFGFFILCFVTGLGVGAFLQQFPTLHLTLKLVSALYLVYLALQIARSRSSSNEDNSTSKPMSFMQAALFQWVNPKAWMMAISAMIMFSNTQAPLASMFWISTVFSLVGLPCVAIWVVFGVGLKRFLSQPQYLKWFNIGMGVLLIASIYPIFYV
ncbi:LysE family translocator [Alkanindiges sp. WGS2144]|uniref:LysE family translocator n=1 Tax=Alkanindiges sp. WGS2144 TaxID=3366808 RepID=UPI003750EA3B